MAELEDSNESRVLRVRIKRRNKSFIVNEQCFAFVEKAYTRGETVNYTQSMAPSSSYFVCRVVEIIKCPEGLVAVLDILEEKTRKWN